MQRRWNVRNPTLFLRSQSTLVPILSEGRYYKVLHSDAIEAHTDPLPFIV